MKKEYQMGLDANVIQGGVAVSTRATAYTAVYRHLPDGTKKKIAESNLQSGNISLRNMGVASDLRGVLLEIQTRVTLSAFPQAEWPQLIKTLSVEYVLDGGQQGHINFDFDPTSLMQVNQWVFVYQFVELL